MNFTALRHANDLLRQTTGVYEKEAIIREALAKCEDSSERTMAAFLLIGKLSQPTEGLTTGIKEAFLAKDLGLEGRQSLESISQVAVARAECGESNPSVFYVWDRLRNYLESPGRTNKDKSRIVNEFLFGFAKSKDDIPFLLQILCEKVNNGVDEKAILYAMAQPVGDERERISRAYAFNPNLAEWVTAADEGRMGSMLQGKAVAGTPIEPQLCARVSELQVVLKEHGGSTLVQPKLDGQRIHIHFWDPGYGAPQVRIYSRALKDVTQDYPEILQAMLPIAATVKQGILDGELVALGPDGEVAPFEVLQKRLGRKTDRDVVQVGVVLYDVLLWADTPVETMPYWQRISLLDEKVHSPKIRVIDSTVCLSAENLRNFLMQSYEDGEEGLVCKDPKSLPEPGMRSKRWIKLKPDYMEEGGFGDSMDLVVIGYNHGRGKRHGKIGALWVGIRDEGRLQVWPVCKVGTGLTDKDLELWQNLLKPLERPAEVLAPVFWSKLVDPPEVDVWVEPQFVIEVKAAEMTKVDKWAGFSLRFPRYIRWRDDKTLIQATSTAEVQIP